MKKRLCRTLLRVLVLAAVFIFAKADPALAAHDVLEIDENITLGSDPIDQEVSWGDAKYSFSIKKSGCVVLTVGVKEGSAYSWGSHGTITLYDADNVKIAEDGIFDGSSGTDYGTITADVLAGDYYLSFTHNGDADRPVWYVLQTSFTDSGETVTDSLDDMHSDITNAIKLPMKKAYTGHIAMNSKQDVYTFTLKKNKFVQFTLTNKTNGLVFQVFNDEKTVDKEFSTEEKKQTEKVFCPKGKYYVVVKRRDAWNDYGYGTYTIKATTSDIPKSKVKSVSNVAGRYIKVKFKSLSAENASGYQIQYSTDKKFKKNVENVEIRNYSSLTPEYDIYTGSTGTYYVRIRVYETDKRNEQYYSAWSAAKSVKVKK